jgi:hypothetical protein
MIKDIRRAEVRRQRAMAYSMCPLRAYHMAGLWFF